MAEPGVRMSLGPPLLNFEFCPSIASLRNTISIGFSVKVNRLMKRVAEFWKYFVDIIINILFVIWQDFVIVWQNTPCTVCHPVMDCLPHWCCWTVLPDGLTQFFTKLVQFCILVCTGVGTSEGIFPGVAKSDEIWFTST